MSSKSNHQKVIDRINQIISQANTESMGGRSKQYIMGGSASLKNNRYPPTINRNYNMMDPSSGVTYIEQSPTGYDIETSMYPKGKLVHLDYKGMGMAPTRKKRSDKGKPRVENEWQRLVKAVAAYEDIPYNKALKRASELKKEGYVAEDFE